VSNEHARTRHRANSGEVKVQNKTLKAGWMAHRLTGQPWGAKGPGLSDHKATLRWTHPGSVGATDLKTASYRWTKVKLLTR